MSTVNHTFTCDLTNFFQPRHLQKIHYWTLMTYWECLLVCGWFFVCLFF